MEKEDVTGQVDDIEVDPENKNLDLSSDDENVTLDKEGESQEEYLEQVLDQTEEDPDKTPLQDKSKDKSSVEKPELNQGQAGREAFYQTKYQEIKKQETRWNAQLTKLKNINPAAYAALQEIEAEEPIDDSVSLADMPASKAFKMIDKRFQNQLNQRDAAMALNNELHQVNGLLTEEAHSYVSNGALTSDEVSQILNDVKGLGYDLKKPREATKYAHAVLAEMNLRAMTKIHAGGERVTKAERRAEDQARKASLTAQPGKAAVIKTENISPAKKRIDELRAKYGTTSADKFLAKDRKTA